MEFNKENFRKILYIIAFGLVLYFLLQNIGVITFTVGMIIKILSPFLIGGCIAFVVNIPMKMFENKIFKGNNKKKNNLYKISKTKRAISLLLSFIIIGILMALIIKLIIPQLIRVVIMLLQAIPSFVYDIQEYISDFISQYPDLNNQLSNLEINWGNIAKEIINFSKNVLTSVGSSSITFVTTLFGGIVDTLIALIFSVYILMGKETLKKQGTKMIYAYFSKEKAKYILEILTMSKETFSNFITGQTTEAVILGVLCFIGCLILKIPSTGAVSVLIGVTALIPIVGAVIGMIIGAILILSVEPIKALVFVIFLLILQQIETNIIYPKVVGSSVGLPGIWVLLAVTVCGSLWGIVGMLFGLPLFSVIYTIIEKDINKRLENKNIEI